MVPLRIDEVAYLQRKPVPCQTYGAFRTPSFPIPIQRLVRDLLDRGMGLVDDDVPIIPG